VTSAWVCVSIMGARGEPGARCLRVCTVSCRLLIIMSVDELAEMVALEGNQVTVSQIRSARVSHTQIL
jgi:hypothetical protein